MNRKILDLAIPNIVSNITVPLLGLVDMTLMGHLGSAVYIGAISLGGVIFNFLYWMFAFLRMGTSGFTAQATGRKDWKESELILGRSFALALFFGVMLIILQVPIEWVSFRILGGSEEVKQLASQYFYIRIWAAPATIGLYSLNGWFIGMQNAKVPMTVAIIINVANIIFSLLFVFAFGMKSDGVALGTVLSQYMGLFLSLWFARKKFGAPLSRLSKNQVLDIKALRIFMLVNSDIFIRTLCIIGVFTFFTSKSAGMNNTVLAVNSLLLQFFMFFSFFMDGFAYAGEALAGKYFGAGSRAKLKKVTQLLFLWGTSLGVTFSLIYLLAGNQIVSLLTDQVSIREAARPFIWWTALVPISGFAAFIWDGVYIGATASKGMRNSMLAATFLLFVPGFLLFKNSMGNDALWLAMILFVFGRGLFQTILAKRAIFKRIH
ncbi:MATE family efflux transporter [Prolixibacter denitrificans]|uniref:MATE family efflux transporter n=1 Tax=Prolixibacter denitrificans TaxID=1541063 RepID=A0A2P8CKA7_9BACT|nr:MATE family efflux transporter [Prolixibacter denitrificans]PSK85400.1 MATE family multidrug resistance protein [Prolixibacter denitrificans]GET20019.1 MATE family efflux transporter [Prolixibacter denitrificans]